VNDSPDVEVWSWPQPKSFVLSTKYFLPPPHYVALRASASVPDGRLQGSRCLERSTSYGVLGQ